MSLNIVQAQRIMAMWRVRGKFPHSADSTAQLLEVICRDKYQSINVSHLFFQCVLQLLSS
jgi:hypothetical protein